LELQGHLTRAPAVTPQIIIDVIAHACLPFQAQHATAKARVFDLIHSGVFVDATRELLKLDLPRRKLRRLVFDGGEWHCSLSQQLELPWELDQTAEGSHEDLTLALLI